MYSVPGEGFLNFQLYIEVDTWKHTLMHTETQIRFSTIFYPIIMVPTNTTGRACKHVSSESMCNVRSTFTLAHPLLMTHCASLTSHSHIPVACLCQPCWTLDYEPCWTLEYVTSSILSCGSVRKLDLRCNLHIQHMYKSVGLYIRTWCRMARANLIFECENGFQKLVGDPL